MAEWPGVKEVHDFHVWTLTSGINAMSAHVVVVDASMHAQELSVMHDTLTKRYRIDHVTIQIEHEGWLECESHL